MILMLWLNTLRPWRPDDLEDLYAYASVPGVGEMAGWPHHEDRETSKGILEHFIEGKKTFALEYQGKVIGSMGIERYDEAKKALIDKYNELGYRDAAIIEDSVWTVDEKHVNVYVKLDEGQKYYIRNITWVGNTPIP